MKSTCLESPMDGGAWWAAVRGVAESRTRHSDFPFTFHFHALEKEMATHSHILAWRITGTAEPGRLPSMGLRRVGHDWSNLAAAAARRLQLLSNTMGCFSGCLMSSAGIQKLFCGIYSAFKCSFDEFFWEKVVSLFCSSGILGLPPNFIFFFFLQSSTSLSFPSFIILSSLKTWSCFSSK